MEIRVIKAPEGVLPELMPEVGAVYRAQKSVRRPGDQQFAEFCWIELKGKKIVLRKGEYEIVAEDPPEEETMHKEQEQGKTPGQEALPAAEGPQKRGPKQKTETNLVSQDTQLAMLRAEMEELLDALTAERARSSRLERALLALTLEHYGR
nr:MAG TPA: hypothetical protein [Caudoviricetes sp.]